MSNPDLSAHHLHVGRTLTVPHEALYRAMRRFAADLERAEASQREEVAAMRSKLGIDVVYVETPDVERYSLAIQVFAAMTIEASISFYAILRFGGEHHDKHFRWGPADERLRKALNSAGVTLDDDSTILGLVEEVMAVRHGIVHPFGTEYTGTERASIRAPDRREPDESAAAARAAIANVDRFLALLRQHDPAHAHYFSIAWSAA